MGESVERLNAEYLWKVGNYLSTVCPAASRYAVFNMERMLLKDDQVKRNAGTDFGAKRQKMFCHHCGNIWQAGNHRVRIKPCPRANKNLKRLLRREINQPWNLTKQEKKRISSFKKSTNKIVYTCFSCRKTTVFPGNKKAKIPESVQNTSTMTLPSMIFKTPKNKKRDINAGLSISACSSDRDASISSLCQSAVKNTAEQPKFSTPFTTKTATTPQSLTFKTPTSGSPVDKSSSIKKSKYSHLCKALQKGAKKPNTKTTLAAFLNSL